MRLPANNLTDGQESTLKDDASRCRTFSMSSRRCSISLSPTNATQVNAVKYETERGRINFDTG